MFFILSKLLIFLLNPLLWVAVLLGLGIFSSSGKRKKICTVSAFAWLLFFSNPLMVNLVMKKWELPPVRKDHLVLYDVGIVLTGITHLNQPADDQLHLSEGADRITEAIRLYHTGFIRKILISGGSGSLVDRQEIESRKLRDLLLTSGVPEDDILVEDKSRNTYENARFSYALLKDNALEDRNLLLITSAFHQRRAMACFSKLQVEIAPFPVDFRSAKPDLDIRWIIPDGQALTDWSLLLKEWVGLAAYKLMGYA